MTGKDTLNTKIPLLKIDDLLARDDNLPVRLSILMSINDFRRGQLARSLECLCRQNWREFEVLVCDNGSPENLQEVFDIFHPFLKLRTVRLERSGYSACPTRGFRELIPMAHGEVFAIMQPEIMLWPYAAYFMYDAHFNEWENAHRYKIAVSQTSMEGLNRWVIPKVGFFNAEGYAALDGVDWHQNIKNIESLPEIMTHCQGLSHTNNRSVIRRREFPWWFAGSAKRESGIWRDMPLFNNHASIDQWLLNYRRIHEYVDVCSRELMGYHQWHHRGKQSVSPEEEDVMPEITATAEEQESWLPLRVDELREWCQSYGIKNVDSSGQIHDYESLWSALSEARLLDGKIREYDRASITKAVNGEIQQNEAVMKNVSVRLLRMEEDNNG